MSQTSSAPAIAKLKQQLQHLVNLRINMPVNNHRDFKYPGGYEELVLAQGTAMTAQPLPEYLESGQPKSCYYNCQQLLHEHPNLVYCEGYALADGLSVAFPHAWLTGDGLGAIDPTWVRPGTAYLGICFQTEWLRKFLSDLINPNKIIFILILIYSSCFHPVPLALVKLRASNSKVILLISPTI